MDADMNEPAPEVADVEVPQADAVDASADPAEKTNGDAVVTEGTEADAVAENPEQAPESETAVAEPEKPAPPTEEQRLWSVVKAKPDDFTSWTLLIKESEELAASENDMSKVENVYDAFLQEFPLCYGYWKKYADHEARVKNWEKVVEVYERAVKAVTYSVDIWMHYSTYLADKSEDKEEVERLFERGIDYVGTDYLAHLLWDKYLDFEIKKEEWSKVAQLYKRILSTPLQQLDRYYGSFKQFAASHTLSELRTPEENAEAAAAAEPAPPADESLEAPPGAETAKAVPTEAEQLEKYLADFDALYKSAKEKDAKIKGFESLIRRPYFHVKPLDDSQLANWHNYLDFVEKEGNFDKIVKVYERCLIACANYQEYWTRYAQRLETTGHVTEALEALSRATRIFVKKQPEPHLLAARIKEHHGDIAGARAEYELLTTELVPGLLEAIVKHANLEIRQGNVEGASAVFEAAIDLEKAKDTSKTLAFLCMSYARFLDQVKKDVEHARSMYDLALSKFPGSRTLLEGLITFESQRGGVERVRLAMEKAIHPKSDGSQALSSSDREALSNLYLQFLDTYADMESIRKAELAHSVLFPKRKAVVESKKRPASDVVASDRSKVQKGSGVGQTPASQAQAPAGGYANGQGQWAGGYQAPAYGAPPAQGAWQAGPPAQPAPQQQWGGYGQGGYYDGYGYGQQPPAGQYPGYGQGYAQPGAWGGGW